MSALEICPVCESRVSDSQEGVECSRCKFWYHDNCAEVISSELEQGEWLCKSCKDRERLSTDSALDLKSMQEFMAKTLLEFKEIARVNQECCKKMESLQQTQVKQVGETPDNSTDAIFAQFEELKRSLEQTTSKTSLASQRVLVQPVNLVNEGASCSVKEEHHSVLEARKGRKYLQELPEFNGDVSRWAGFITIYKETTIAGRYSEVENKARLAKCLKGRAAQLVAHLLRFSSDASLIIEELTKVYGRKEVLAISLIKELLKFPEIKNERDPKLREFAIEVLNFVASMKAVNRQQDLRNEYALSQLEAKLSSSYFREWHKRKREFPNNEKEEADFEDFSKFLNDIASELPVIEVALRSNKDYIPKRVNTHQEVTSKNLKCYKCEKAHTLKKCEHFLKMSPEQRWNFVVSNKICNSCLSKNNHDFKNCARRQRCNESGCERFHHRLLHKSMRTDLSATAPVFRPPANLPTSNNNETGTSHNNHTVKTDSILYKIVPVKLFKVDDRSQYVETYALFDDGSGISMVDESLFDRLGIVGETETLSLQWTKGIQRQEKASCASLQISSIDGGEALVLENVYAVENLNLAKQSFNVKEMTNRYPHLRGLKLTEFHEVQPKLLIGLPHVKFMKLENHRYGKEEDAPVASKSSFGWVVYGPSAPSVGVSVESVRYHQSVRLSYHQASKEDDQLHNLVKGYFSTENFGVTSQRFNLVGADEKRANKIMGETLKYDGQQYEIGLLWKNDHVQLPDSRGMAFRRLLSEEKSLAKKGLLEWKRKHMQDQLDKGYVRIADTQDLETEWPRVWYCPRFIVVNENKSPPKPRDVCDVAATVNGVSLNSCLLKGPDNLVPLIRGLFKLRENRIAFTADVREMFHQIKIKKEDQQCQRFLWRDCNQQVEPSVFIMQVMMFGPTCSPTCAQFVKNHHAEKLFESHPRAARTLINDTYVDDVFGSEPSVEEAVEVCRELIEVCRTCHFDLVGFKSNSKDLLTKLPLANVKGGLVEVNLKGDNSAVIKVLGMFWDTDADKFMFRIKCDDNFNKMIAGSCPTKREVLQFIMKIFDPLGLIANVVVQGKIILQDIWKSGIGWDDCIAEELHEEWKKFMRLILKVETISIPRCYAYISPKQYQIQLIVFVDASEKAFAATAYFRFFDINEQQICVGHIMGKAKVAPVKKLTIPQLELQAAVLGARLVETIKRLHSFNIQEVKLLSDSRTVLCWINSKDFKFKTFVAARIGEILDLTTQAEWYYVKTKDNVADDGTRCCSRDVEDDDRWFRGADFLQLKQSDWPIKRGIEVVRECNNDVSVIGVNIHQMEKDQFSELDRVSGRCQSNWSSLVRVIAFIMRWKNRKLQGPVAQQFVSNAEFLSAQLVLFKKIQFESFPEIVANLVRKKNQLEVDSIGVDVAGELRSLCPFIDDEKLIRMSSRNQSERFTYDQRNPIILPNKHRLVDLLIYHVHERNYHQHEDTIIGDLRNVVWIINVRKAVKRVRANCQVCKLKKSTAYYPKMGNLPECRLDFGCKPFTHVGIDVFGPYEVKIGRSMVKRYGILFTCMTYRAVHIELCKDLSTDACLLSIRNFIAVRGQSQHFYSDNGTNFVGAQNIIRGELAKMQNQLGEAVAKRLKVDWHFIPAYSPWFGGAWERLIGSVKKCLSFALKGEEPKEEVLETTLKKVAYMMNRRPLTHTPTEADEKLPLTPNSVLFGDDYSERGLPVGMFSEKDGYSKQLYRRAQFLVQKFMHRWIRDYLPEITRREKWLDVKQKVQMNSKVLLIEPNEPRQMWKMGVVVNLFRGKDGEVRVVDVQLSNGAIKKSRSVGRLVVMEI